MFWGDQMGAIIDPFGHTWMIATRTKNLTHKQMAEAGAGVREADGGAASKSAAQ